MTSAEAMRNLLSSARVPDMLVEHILGLGFEDIADFAYAYADASDLSKLLDGVPAETWTSMGVTGPEHSIPAARIRRAFVMAKASASQESLALTPTAPGSHAGQVLPGPQASPAIAWAEHLPPKLSPEVVQDLVDKFQRTAARAAQSREGQAKTSRAGSRPSHLGYQPEPRTQILASAIVHRPALAAGLHALCPCAFVAIFPFSIRRQSRAQVSSAWHFYAARL